jgi:hypothetical protein
MTARRLTLSILVALFGAVALTLGATAAFAAKEHHPGIPPSFGSAGSKPGQLKTPSGVALNDSTGVEPGAGDVYVIDLEDNRVERFGAAGEYKGQFNGGGEFEVEGKEEKGSAAPTGAFSFGETLLGNGLAVDNSGESKLEDPSVGDVYVADSGHRVVDEFGPFGEYVTQLTGTCEKAGACPGKAVPFMNVYAVAVDPSGNLWVAYTNAETAGTVHLAEFTGAGAFVKSFSAGEGAGFFNALAVDANDVYFSGVGRAVDKFDAQTGAKLARFGGLLAFPAAYGVTALAIEPGSGDLYVDDYSSGWSEETSNIEVFGPGGEPYAAPLETFPFKNQQELERSARTGVPPRFEFEGIAVNPAGTVYASVRNTSGVAIFEDVSLPEMGTAVVTEASTTEDDVVLHANFDPEGATVGSCHFEYVSDEAFRQDGWAGAEAVECEPAAGFIAGNAPVAIQARVSGLHMRESYRARLVAVADGKRRGSGEAAFFTSARPLVEGEASTSVGSIEATVDALIDPSGLSTTYRVEYGTANVEEFSTLAVNVGTATGPVSVSAVLSQLRPGTSYRFRLVASNSLGAVAGDEIAFTTSEVSTTGAVGGEATCPNETFSGFDAMLPDCRAYELVSVPQDDTYVPDYDEPGSETTGEITGGPTPPGQYRAAAAGDAVAYEGGPAASGLGGSGRTGNGGGNRYLAVRGAKGWEAADLDLPINAELGGEDFLDFSDDLSVEIAAISGYEGPSEPEAPAECRGHNGGEIYARTTSGLHALITANRGAGTCYAASAGISADSSHILLQSRNAYTTGANKGAAEEDFNLYDWVGGVLHQVNLLPDGEPEKDPDATFGGKVKGQANYAADVSANGSRVFWTALEGGSGKALYVRENDAQPQSPVASGRCTVPTDACTVQIAEGGQFWAASSDGSVVFFTKDGDLYEFDVEGERATDLAPGGEVQGVIGASEDGSYVYFVADGVLAGRNAEGKTPTSKQPNLYMWRGGETTFVATLEAEDNVIHSSGGGQREFGDWQVEPGARTAEVAPEGRVVGFMSRLPLTGYDNRGITFYENSTPPKPIYENFPEVFLYDAGTGRIACASCNPTGAPPLALPLATVEAEPVGGAYVATSGNPSFMSRWVSEQEGAQLYFMTNQPLVPDDTNDLQDVYEWESEGSGGCRKAAGCIGLISGAEPGTNAYFIDASANGGDVFFTSRSQLVAAAVDETVKVYDARVDGGKPEPLFACTGTGCQGVPPAPPIFATPSSVTFNGVGNFEPSPQPVKPKPKSKKPAKCKRGLHRRHSKCVKIKIETKKAGRFSKRSSATRKGR